MSGEFGVVVVGAGFSGLLLAIQLLRAAPKATIALIERAEEFGRGLAYGTGDPRHLLNVRAGNMSAFPEDPDHFIRWLALHAPPHKTPQGFVPRALYGTYLQALLATTLASEDGAARLVIVPDEVVALTVDPLGVKLRLAVGRHLKARQVVLATGHLPPHDLPAFPPDVLGSGRYIRDPWAPGAFAAVEPLDQVLLVGTGLTAVDVLLGLERRGHVGRVVALSRHGLSPRAHDLAGPPAATLDLPARPELSALLRLVRRVARDGGWRAAVDGLRPHMQRLWREASAAQRCRFLRHLRSWWDIHRHRMAPAVAAIVEDSKAKGRFAVYAGKIQSAAFVGASIEVTWRPRGEGTLRSLAVDRIINCTGPAGKAQDARSPLLAGLLAQGLARPDPLGLGIEVDAEGRVLDAGGRPSPVLSAVGPMSRGAYWEVIAVPDIRVQARDVAWRLSGILG